MAVTEIFNGGRGRRDIIYAACGIVLGCMAPIGWILLRLMLFWNEGSSLLDQVLDDITATTQSRFMYAYMCGGTMMVLGTCGFFIGRASQQIYDRAVKLDLLNHEIEEQKTTFERRFTDLDHSIKNFHNINAEFQKSVDPQEILRLTADGLHEVIGFDRVNVLMVDEERKHLSFAACRGETLSDADASGKLPLDVRKVSAQPGDAPLLLRELLDPGLQLAL